MSNYCPPGQPSGNVGNRNNWGVDLNRNSTIGSIFDGYSGASDHLHQRHVRRPVRGLRAGDQERAVGRGHVPEDQVRDQHPHARRLLHVGAGRVQRGRAARRCRRRTSASRSTSSRSPTTILSHIKSSRDTAILPQRTGPIADVLYSAAGNSADDMYYRKGIIAYSFEAGAQRITVNPTTGAIIARERRLPAVLRRPGHRGGQGTTCGTVDSPERAAGQRGPRRGDGVRRRQLRPAPGRPGVLAGRDGAGRRRSSTRPRRPAATRSTTGSTGSARRRSSTTRRTARRRHRAGRLPRRSWTSVQHDDQVLQRPGSAHAGRGPDAQRARRLHDQVDRAWTSRATSSAVKTQRLLVAADDADGTVGGTVPATLSLTLGTPARVRRVHPGRRQATTRRRPRPT